ncbi:MAG: hypothetical protein CTY15_06150 [Methylocystis sp.]|nr:MAG: hypothetical protein CTY15_06150 [Methylocystis sp.]
MTAAASLRERLRIATAASHMRLHRHDGLASAARGSIDLDDYRLLLMRLYGFHLSAEERLAGAVHRTGLDRGASRALLIERDLVALGVSPEAMARLPVTKLAIPSSDAGALGALYVIEGSALGGLQIAKALEPVARDARRFFLGDLAWRAVWPALIARLDGMEAFAQEASDAISGAVATFEAFEDWMQDWRTAAAGVASAPRAQCDA